MNIFMIEYQIILIKEHFTNYDTKIITAFISTTIF